MTRSMRCACGFQWDLWLRLVADGWHFVWLSDIVYYCHLLGTVMGINLFEEVK